LAGATQLPFDWQGKGPGKFVIGSGPLTALDMWAGTVGLAVLLNDAEARPAKATSSAKIRMAAFIFGNLSLLAIFEEIALLLCGNRSAFPIINPVFSL
jgi:hypothetical protein